METVVTCVIFIAICEFNTYLFFPIVWLSDFVRIAVYRTQNIGRTDRFNRNLRGRKTKTYLSVINVNIIKTPRRGNLTSKTDVNQKLTRSGGYVHTNITITPHLLLGVRRHDK